MNRTPSHIGTLKIKLASFEFTLVRKHKAAVQMHTLLDLQGNIPSGRFAEARSWCCCFSVCWWRDAPAGSQRGFRRPYASPMGYPDNLCQSIFAC